MSLKKYTVIAAMGCTVPAGSLLGLTEKQAARRAHVLEKVRKGVYQATGKVSFKHGEVIGFDGDANKVLMSEVEAVEGKKKPAKKKAKPAAKKAAKGKGLVEKLKDKITGKDDGEGEGNADAAAETEPPADETGGEDDSAPVE